MKSKMVMAGLAGLALATAADAAVLNVVTTLSQARRLDNNAVIANAAYPATLDPAVVGAARYTVQMRFTATGFNTSTEYGWGNMALNIGGLDANLTRAAGSNYIATNPSIQVAGAGTTDTGDDVFAPKFSINGDTGSNTTDLQGLVVSTPGGLTDPTDPRLSLGQAAAELFGSFAVNWNGTNALLQIQDNGWSKIAKPSGQLAQTADTFTTPDVPFTPEPASLGLLALGGLMLARRRRA